MTPYYEADGITIYHGDALEILDSVEADVCVTDPPYGETSLRWDVWQDAWPTQVRAPQLWCCGSMRMFLTYVADFTTSWRFGQDLVWEKHNGSNFHADRFRRVHEHLTHWYRGAWGSLYLHVPTIANVTPGAILRRNQGPPHLGQKIADSAYTAYIGGPRLMRSVLYERSCHGEAVHPTQKPLGILRAVIEYSCPSGGTVLDPFMGSGSVLEAARQLGRRAAGIEIDERYCEIAARRLEQGVLVL